MGRAHVTWSLRLLVDIGKASTDDRALFRVIENAIPDDAAFVKAQISGDTVNIIMESSAWPDNGLLAGPQLPPPVMLSVREPA